MKWRERLLDLLAALVVLCIFLGLLMLSGGSP